MIVSSECMLTYWARSRSIVDEDEEDVNALVEKLRSPMNAQSQELKKYMAETIFPVVQRVKEVHEVLEDEGWFVRKTYSLLRPLMAERFLVDLAYGTGLLAFDEVCKRVETLALHTEDETRTEYIDTQVIQCHRYYHLLTDVINHFLLLCLNIGFIEGDQDSGGSTHRSVSPP